MRQAILTFLLTAVSQSATAAWFKVNANEITSLYADPTSIIRSNKTVKIRVLADKYKMTKTADKRYLSLVIQVEYDCNEKASRILDLTAYSKNMGKGKMIYTISEPDPKGKTPVSPESEDEILWEYACSTQ